MKNQTRRREDGVALLTVLAILTIISFIIISLLVVNLNEEKVTRFDLKSSEARLAADSGFRDARNLLTHLTAQGAYMTTVATTTNKVGSKGDGKLARYTFISQMEKGKIHHYPLFTGGKKLERSVTNIAALPCGSGRSDDLLAVSPILPEIQFSENVDNYLATYGLTGMNAVGNLEGETTSPLVGQITMDGESGERFMQRYSFWMEDLEGYPNLDLVNGHLNDRGEFEFELTGNSPGDKRVEKNLFQPLAVNPELGFIFKESSYGQKRWGLAAPGLSPQELLLFSRALPTKETHPYHLVHQLLSGRSESLAAGGHLSQAPGMENRLVLGLFPYYDRPKIPFNHGYDDEGKPPYQLNRLVMRDPLDREAEIEELRSYLSRNLPKFNQRKGGFPEDYLGTIVANMVDYADVDSKPTVRKELLKNEHGGKGVVEGKAAPLNLLKLKPFGAGFLSKADGAVYDQDKDYRGVDSYTPVNEFFYRIQVETKTNNRMTISVMPFVEFWNPFPEPVTMENVSVNFWFVEPFRFKAGAGEYFLNSPVTSWKVSGYENEDWPSSNAAAQPRKLTVPGNSYLVHNFGKIIWNLDLEVSTKIDSIGSPAKSGDKDGKAQMQLLIDGVVVDQSGRPYHVNSNGQEIVGYNIPRFRDTNATTYTYLTAKSKGLSTGDYMMVYYRPANERQISGYGTFLGDPFMTYYGAGHSQDTVYSKSTPGSRNHYDHSVKDLLKSETRVRDWPDRGYDEPSGRKPKGTTDALPDSAIFSTPSSRVATAPFRISNRGRYFSLTELGNLHDPVMWMVKPSSVSSSAYSAGSASRQRYSAFGGVDEKANALWFYPDKGGSFDAIGDDVNYSKIFGGGNTLRIGRKEHPLFDHAGMRATQLLDLLQVGVNGSNAVFEKNPDDYASFDPARHYPPTAALSEKESATLPYTLIYPPHAHGCSEFRKIHGLLNINTAPSVFEIEGLLRSPFLMNELLAPVEKNSGSLKDNGVLNLQDGSDPTYSIARNGLVESEIPKIALGLIKARPFASASHLARVLSELIYQHDALPPFPNDQIMEEPVARVLNMTHLTSRHFRIFVAGEVVPKPPVGSGLTEADMEPVSRSTWVHEVYLQEERDPITGLEKMDPVSGKPIITCKILSSREI